MFNGSRNIVVIRRSDVETSAVRQQHGLAFPRAAADEVVTKHACAHKKRRRNYAAPEGPARL